jgi:metallo-beta-lactamase family protein
MKLTFAGGAQGVTGSNYLLESRDTRLLIDCGLFQGNAETERQNDTAFPYDVHAIDAVLVTHAHIDHIGRIPKLMKAGYQGPIFSTAPTREAAYELLLDAYHLMLHQHPNNEPLYGIEHIDMALAHWKSVDYHAPFDVKSAHIEYFDAGHILGSASILVHLEGKNVAFSGDLGNVPAPLVKDTEYIQAADYALIESAYGNRVHESVEERQSILEDLIEDTVKSSGTLMIPAFALERTQELLYEINDLASHGRIPRVPIFIDSPLAIKLTSIYQKYINDPRFFDEEARARAAEEKGEIFNFPGLRFTLTTEQSKEINQVPPPKVIIAGSGMSQGGRIMHHQVRYLPDPNSTLLFVGFQPEGSMGRAIMEGARGVTIMGEEIPVRARVRAIGGYSAHADQPRLLKWIEPMRSSLKKVFVVQGEPDQSEPLAARIQDEYAIEAIVPEAGYSIEL